MESELSPKDDIWERGGGGGLKKRRERSAVKTEQTPDKVLVFSPLHAKLDPRKNWRSWRAQKQPKKCKTSATDCWRKRDRNRRQNIYESAWSSYIYIGEECIVYMHLLAVCYVNIFSTHNCLK